MVSQAKRKARREEQEAAEAAAARAEEEEEAAGIPSDDDSDSSDDSDSEEAAPSKRPRDARTPTSAAAARVGLTGAARAASGGGATTSEGGGGAPGWKNKEKPLVLSSRGIPGRYRHLMLDLAQLIPHCKKDSKLDTKDERVVINEVAELQGCTSAVFFEARKHQDLYIWMAKSPSGPTVKFNITNVHTMSELKLTGNHLKGSRAVLYFDGEFDTVPHLKVIKGILTQIFATPRGHRKSKPFLDHTMCFYWLDNRVWFRNYQAVWPEGKSKDPPSLIEVGPRMVMNPIRVFAGSFRGQVLWSNADYVSPNAIRRSLRDRHGASYERKVKAKQKRKEHANKWRVDTDEFQDLFK